ncbi:hypothetical protein [Streptosporangium sp. V21-05]|uniref:hypothetical protein n=1 Tax=Streptosporangium sp. V21-05 TaxID=3446115 RepID=UPI003F538E82
MGTQVTLDDADHGEDQSREAWFLREGGGISEKRNIATYVEVGSKVVNDVRVNLGHSEHLLIEDLDEGIRKLIADEVYPGRYVIDWIYTERPACPEHDYAFPPKRHDAFAKELRRHAIHKEGEEKAR